MIGKPRGSGLELSAIAAGLMIITFVAMWIQRPDASCTLAVEGRRTLDLTRAIDREHLATDLAAADRIARGSVLRSDDRDQQQARYIECDDTLVREIAARHRLSLAEVRAGGIAAWPVVATPDVMQK
jgi:hypothetical protein